MFTAFGTAAAGPVALAMQANGSFVAAGGGHAARYRTDGSLDAGGVVDLEFDPSHAGSEATALGVDSDGKLVAGGKVFLSDYDMALARYLPDYSGGLDPAFGTAVPQNGLALAGIAGTIETRAMAIRSDGKIVVAGHTFFNDFNFAIGRFKSDGMPDEACLGVGLATVNFGVGDDSAAAVVVAGDRTYVAGTVAVVGGTDFGLVRLNDACAIDDAGGPIPNDYKFTFDLGGNDEMGGMVQQGSKFVMAGTSAGNIVLVRTRQSLVTGNVFLDTAFGDAGQAVLDLGPGEVVSALGQQSDGKLVVVGTVPLGGGSDFFVVRFTADGQIDEDFGLGGVAYASFNSIDNAQALAIRDDDTIVVAGCTTTADGQVFAVVQFTPDGSFDNDFNGDGRVTLRTGPSGEECAQAATFVGPERLVVGGYSSFFGTRNFVLAAFQGATPTTTTTSVTTTTLGSTECGDVNGDMAITATDALGVLVAAVGLNSCELCVCDTDGSGIIAASDSLRVLGAAVGQSVTLVCPVCG